MLAELTHIMSSQILESQPELQAADQTESYSYKGYDDLNKPLTNAAFYLMGSVEQTRDLLTGRKIDRSALEEVEEPRYLQGSADFLHTQGMVETTPSEMRLTRVGADYVRDYKNLRESVKSYEAIQELLKGSLGWEHDKERITPAMKKLLETVETAHPKQLEVLLPAAVTFFQEKKVSNGGEVSAASVLTSGHAIDVAELIQTENIEAIFAYIESMRKMGLVELEFPYLVATEKGKKIFKLGGYAELELSYYSMFQRLTALTRGELKYGFGHDVNRDTELNANASNGILKLRVAPYIATALGENKHLKSLGEPEAYIDYGSGGGDMLMQVAENGPQSVQKLIGIDINPDTNGEAERLLAEAEIGISTDLITGSITDPKALQRARERLTNGKEMKSVASINFILHDIGPELAREFLKNHAAIFPDTPLVITETLRMPTEVLRTHPNYQAASFQFMHKASGQHLYDEAELKALLKDCGYTIEHEETHSSMPSEKNDGSRLKTIVTYICQPNKA